MARWFCLHNGVQTGPLSTAQLRDLAVKGQLLRTDLVWMEGMTDWIEARNVKNFFPIAAPAPPSLTPITAMPPPRPPRNSASTQAADASVVVDQQPWVTPPSLPPPLPRLTSVGAAQPAAAEINPYAAPTLGIPPRSAEQEYSAARSGPPWEQDGASFKSFLATAKLAYSSPGCLFRAMRREGGFSAPLFYSLAGQIVGALATSLWAVPVQLLVTESADERGFLLVWWFIMFPIIVPVAIAIGLFLNSAILHVSLMALRGANQSYETTYRVVSYAFGSAALLGMIPFCGASFLQPIYALVMSGVGLSAAHETSGLKATLAILLPQALGCCTVAFLYVAIVGLAVANAN